MTAFSAALRYAMTTRGMTGVALAATIGASPQSVSKWRCGQAWPGLVLSLRLAEELGRPSLHDIVLARATRVCAAADCGQTFVDISDGLSRRWCSRPCRHNGRQRQRRASATVRSSTIRHRWEAARDAIAAFCAACEPAGLCRDASCPLRPVSPLPLTMTRIEAAALTFAPMVKRPEKRAVA